MGCNVAAASPTGVRQPAVRKSSVTESIKESLRTQGITDSDLAKHLKVSLATVERILDRGDLMLSRLECMCSLLGRPLSEFVGNRPPMADPITRLTREQERELTGDPRLLLMCYLLVNRWNVAEIKRHFCIEGDDAKQLLRRLQRMNLVDVLPSDEVRVLTASNFRWRKDGPVQRFFTQQVQKEFLRGDFHQSADVLFLLGGTLSESSRKRIADGMRRLAAEIQELSRRDAREADEKRSPVGAVIGALEILCLYPMAKTRNADSQS